MTTWLYYDPDTGAALYTITGMEPDGAHIEVPADFDITGVQVIDGVPVRSEPDPAQVLAERRAAASMSRSDFLLASIGAGIIQPSDAGPAARGEIPPSLMPVFEDLPPAVQIEAIVRWGAATMIERTNPILAALAEAMQITEAQLDALFGIGG